MKQPIGVIDSGVGGLTVVHELMRQLPKENLIYLGDTARCPYGPRKEEEVLTFTWEMVQFLLEKEIKMLIIACNTATAFALKDLQTKLSIPVIGVIKPGARAAIKVTKNNYVGVIGTEGTIHSRAYEHELKKLKTTIQYQGVACPAFVPMVEKGITQGERAKAIVEQELQELKKYKKMDTLVLGCTHYPIIKNTIQEVIGNRISIISSSEETARETSTVLDYHHLLNDQSTSAQYQFYTTGELSNFVKIAHGIFWDFDVSKIQMDTVKITN